jgi:NosR/NirI family nitrous oxide reductase transcriptional regulator
MVQAIMPDGAIHPNECLSCMHCQELFTCDKRCPVMISKRERRERRLGLSKETKKNDGQIPINKT